MSAQGLFVEQNPVHEEDLRSDVAALIGMCHMHASWVPND